MTWIIAQSISTAPLDPADPRPTGLLGRHTAITGHVPFDLCARPPYRRPMATGLPAPLHRRAARNRSIDRQPVRSFDRGLWMWTGLIDETVSLVGRQSSGAVCVSWNKQSTCVTNVRSRTRRNLESPSFADFRPPDASASCASAIIRIERRRTRARRGSTAGKAAAPFKDPFGTPGIDRGRRHRPPRRVARCVMCGPSTFAAAAATWEATSIEPLAPSQGTTGGRPRRLGFGGKEIEAQKPRQALGGAADCAQGCLRRDATAATA